MRLVPELLDHFEIHLINYGPLPEHDSLFDEVKCRIEIHSPREDNDSLGASLLDLLRELRPAAVVFGETPLRGNMWLSHRVAASLRIRQVCIENYYGSFVRTYLPAEWPDIDHWLLLGLVPKNEPDLCSNRICTVPPLVSIPSLPSTRDRICVFGYDEATLVTATKLLKSWPGGEIDYIIAPQWRGLVTEASGRILELPSDDVMRDCLAHARLVIGKAGFQQIVEAICFGAPIVCRICGGGVTTDLLADYLRPFVRFIHDDTEVPILRRMLPEWLASLPPNPWPAATARIPNPAAYAASKLHDMVVGPLSKGTAPERAGSAPPEWPLALGTRSLQELLRLLERKDWAGLDAALAMIRISVQGVRLSSGEFVRGLRSGVASATSIKALPMERISTDDYRCCMMAIEPDSWRKREIEFTVRLAFDNPGQAMPTTIEVWANPE